MSASKNETPEDFGARALEVLEQAYAYYSEPPRRPSLVVENDVETYFEYVEAA